MAFIEPVEANLSRPKQSSNGCFSNMLVVSYPTITSWTFAVLSSPRKRTSLEIKRNLLEA